MRLSPSTVLAIVVGSSLPLSAPRGLRSEERSADACAWAALSDHAPGELVQLLAAMATAARGPLVTLELDGVEVRLAVEIIARESGANVFIAQDVRGRVTLKLDATPWREALARVAAAAGCSLRRSSTEAGSEILRFEPGAAATLGAPSADPAPAAFTE